jgi:hypothetical protein
MPFHEGGPLQPQEQTLPEPADKLGILERWFKHQGIVDEVFAERERQVEQWGDGMPPLGTTEDYAPWRDAFRAYCQRRSAKGTVTMADVLLEEVFEALAETDPAKARDELVQAVAVGVKMIEGIDRGATATEGVSA